MGLELGVDGNTRVQQRVQRGRCVLSPVQLLRLRCGSRLRPAGCERAWKKTFSNFECFALQHELCASDRVSTDLCAPDSDSDPDSRSCDSCDSCSVPVFDLSVAFVFSVLH